MQDASTEIIAFIRQFQLDAGQPESDARILQGYAHPHEKFGRPRARLREPRYRRIARLHAPTTIPRDWYCRYQCLSPLSRGSQVALSCCDEAHIPARAAKTIIATCPPMGRPRRRVTRERRKMTFRFRRRETVSSALATLIDEGSGNRAEDHYPQLHHLASLSGEGRDFAFMRRSYRRCSQ